jgi:GxxExxY protein
LLNAELAESAEECDGERKRKPASGCISDVCSLAATGCVMLEHEDLTRRILGAAVEVHRHLGPGLLESAYEMCFLDELQRAGLAALRQVALPVEYKGRVIDCGYRMDIVVESLVLVEIKAVEELHPVHEAQLLSYLRLAKLPVGLLINFHAKVLMDGVKRRAFTRPSY